MPTPGIDCHIGINGYGYIMASTGDQNQETGMAAQREETAPMFGDPNVLVDPLASDLTLILPIGQNDFSDGIGTTDLEKQPKGYERGENLMLTPNNTLINGPKVNIDTFTAGVAPTASTGFISGVMNNGTARYYVVVGGSTYYWNGSSWSDQIVSSNILDVGSYAGKMIYCLGTGGLYIVDGVTESAGTYYAYKFFTLNGKPFIAHSDGRIYSAFLERPEAPTVISQSSGILAAEYDWTYGVVYMIDGTPDLFTELGDLVSFTVVSGQEPVITLPVHYYKGGPVLRRLYRTSNNVDGVFKLVASDVVLGSLQTRYVDTTLDGALGASLDLALLNNTALNILQYGSITTNMVFPDTHQSFMAESDAIANSGSSINSIEVFRDSDGDEAVLIGCTNGLFTWDGVNRSFRTLRLYPYHSANLKYMAVNHGVVYFTMYGNTVNLWSGETESALRGPWEIHFSTVYEIRLKAVGNYVFISVSGVLNYDSRETIIIYGFDGTVFRYSYRNNNLSGLAMNAIMGTVPNKDEFRWFETGQSNKHVNYISLAPVVSSYQTEGVLFRSGNSDLDLPRVRKQIHGVMIRYRQLTTQMQTTITAAAAAGATTITVASITGLAVNDWIVIYNPSENLSEYRKISAIVGLVLTLTHTLGAPLKRAHTSGTAIYKSGAIVTIRNVFTDALPLQDITVGGPGKSDDSFALIKFPEPVYTYIDGINIVWNSGTVMELEGWSMLTALNPPYSGMVDINIRIQDFVKLPNNEKDIYTAAEIKTHLVEAYNKGTVTVDDPLNARRQMRFQRLSFDFEVPKERHDSSRKTQATAHVRLVDENAELLKQETLTLAGISR